MPIVRKQIRDALTTALTGLATTGARVFPSRHYVLTESDLPALRIYTDDEGIEMLSKGVNRLREHTLNLVVECCGKVSTDLDDLLDQMAGEVLQRIDVNQSPAGAKYVEPKGVEIDMESEADKEIGVARLSFEVAYITAQGAPDATQ